MSILNSGETQYPKSFLSAVGAAIRNRSARFFRRKAEIEIEKILRGISGTVDLATIDQEINHDWRPWLDEYYTSLAAYGGETETVEAITFYVSKTGSDLNAGTEASPLLTLKAALDRVPQTINHKVEVRVLGNTDGTEVVYDEGAIDRQFKINTSGSLLIVAVADVVEVLPSQALTVASVGSAAHEYTGGAWAPNAHIGHWLQFTSGANDGMAVPIGFNTATRLIVRRAWIASMNSCDARIIRPSVVIRPDNFNLVIDSGQDDACRFCVANLAFDFDVPDAETKRFSIRGSARDHTQIILDFVSIAQKSNFYTVILENLGLARGVNNFVNLAIITGANLDNWSSTSGGIDIPNLSVYTPGGGGPYPILDLINTRTIQAVASEGIRIFGYSSCQRTVISRLEIHDACSLTNESVYVAGVSEPAIQIFPGVSTGEIIDGYVDANGATNCVLFQRNSGCQFKSLDCNPALPGHVFVSWGLNNVLSNGTIANPVTNGILFTAPGPDISSPLPLDGGVVTDNMGSFFIDPSHL